MDIHDLQKCAHYYKEHYVEQFHIITTYNDTCFIVIGERQNFPHLMGIPKKKYISNGYSKAKNLYEDILNSKPINTAIVPNNISITSKMYQKVLNFCSSKDILWRNTLPILINFDASKSSSKLNSVSKLLIDCDSGYMLGCEQNTSIKISGSISFTKYCISSWMDENGNANLQKEKYMKNQDVEVIKSVLSLGCNSDSVTHPLKTYYVNKQHKTDILNAVARNNSNLLINKRNENNYVVIAQNNNIHCKINGVQY